MQASFDTIAVHIRSQISSLVNKTLFHAGKLPLQASLFIIHDHSKILTEDNKLIPVISDNTPMGEEFKWLLKEGPGFIFECFDI